MDSELPEVLVLSHSWEPQRLARESLLQRMPHGRGRRGSEPMAVTHTCLRELSQLTQWVTGVKRQGV